MASLRCNCDRPVSLLASMSVRSGLLSMATVGCIFVAVAYCVSRSIVINLCSKVEEAIANCVLGSSFSFRCVMG